MPSEPTPTQAYRELLTQLFEKQATFHKLDAYLEGRTKDFPKSNAPPTTEMLATIVNFPKGGLSCLEDELFNKPYTILTLAALHGDEVLLYALLAHKISIFQFDWSKIRLLQPTPLKILRSARRSQKLRQELRIPPHIECELEKAKDIQIIIRPPPVRPRIVTPIRITTTPPSSPKAQPPKRRKTTTSGVYVDGILVEDFDEDEEEESSSIAVENLGGTYQNKMSSSIASSSLAPSDRESRLAKLRSLDFPPTHQSQQPLNLVRSRASDHKSSRQLSTPLSFGLSHNDRQTRLSKLNSLALEPSIPQPKEEVEDENVPLQPAVNSNKGVSGPPYRIRLSRIPYEASVESIKIFLEVGAEAFKAANSLNHRTDALWRYVSKYRRNGFKGLIKAKFSNLKDPDNPIVMKDEKGDFQTAIVSYDNLEEAKKAFEEFHDKRYLYHDALAPRLICEWVTE